MGADRGARPVARARDPREKEGGARAGQRQRRWRGGVVKRRRRARPPKETPELLKFARQFCDGFMVMLMIAGALCFVAQVRRARGARTLFFLQPRTPSPAQPQGWRH